MKEISAGEELGFTWGLYLVPVSKKKKPLAYLNKLSINAYSANVNMCMYLPMYIHV